MPRDVWQLHPPMDETGASESSVTLWPAPIRNIRRWIVPRNKTLTPTTKGKIANNAKRNRTGNWVDSTMPTITGPAIDPIFATDEAHPAPLARKTLG